MQKNIYKIIWKRRKRNRFLLLEFLISFVVTFGISIFLVNYVINYNKPLGFNYHNIWEVYLEAKGDKSNRDIDAEIKSILDRIESYDQVESVEKLMFNCPFRFNFTVINKFSYKNEKNIRPYAFCTGDKFDDVFQIKLVEGRWFNSSDNASKFRPVVINRKLRDELFGNRNRKVIGEVVNVMNNQQCVIVGVINEFRYLGDFSKTSNCVFVRTTDDKGLNYSQDIEENSTIFGGYDNSYLRVKPDVAIDFEEKIYSELRNDYPNWLIKFTTLEKVRENYFKRVWIPMIIILLIAGFLIFNVVLGLFGVLWYNISLRKSEIGLRMAVGANKGEIYRHFIGEMLVLATLGIIPGLVIAVQFPILKVFEMEYKVYIIAMLIAIVLIYLLVTICSLIPSAQATKIQPAEALHEE